MTARKIPAADLEKITRERLALWGTRLLENSGTPTVLIGVCHNDRKGHVTIHVTEDMPIEEVRLLIAFLYQEVVVKARKF